MACESQMQLLMAACLHGMTFEMLFQKFLSLLASPVHQAEAGSPLQNTMHCTINLQQQTELFNTRFTGTNIYTGNTSVVQPWQSRHRAAAQAQRCQQTFLCETPPGLTRAAAAKVIHSMAITRMHRWNRFESAFI